MLSNIKAALPAEIASVLTDFIPESPIKCAGSGARVVSRSYGMLLAVYCQCSMPPPPRAALVSAWPHLLLPPCVAPLTFCFPRCVPSLIPLCAFPYPLSPPPVCPFYVCPPLPRLCPVSCPLQ